MGLIMTSTTQPEGRLCCNVKNCSGVGLLQGSYCNGKAIQIECLVRLCKTNEFCKCGKTVKHLEEFSILETSLRI